MMRVFACRQGLRNHGAWLSVKVVKLYKLVLMRGVPLGPAPGVAWFGPQLQNRFKEPFGSAALLGLLVVAQLHQPTENPVLKFRARQAHFAHAGIIGPFAGTLGRIEQA